jgi:hypothetical protein
LEIQDSLNSGLTPEFLLLQQVGRDLLREVGVDPTTAFPGGINDPMLASVPAAAELLNAISKKKGLIVSDIIYTPAGRDGTGIDTPGPWDDYWDSFGGGGSGNDDGNKHLLEDLYVCLADEGARITAVYTGVYWLVGKAGYTGTALLTMTTAGVSTVMLTVGAGVTALAATFFAYRVKGCIDEKARTTGCHITMMIEEDCQNKVNQGPPAPLGPDATNEEKVDHYMRTQKYEGCKAYLVDLAADKFHQMIINMGVDSFKTVLAASFVPADTTANN